MPSGRERNTMTIHAVSWEDSILPQPLTFVPPYAELASNASGFSRWWQFAHYAFHLPDPAKFAPIPVSFEDAERRSVERFLESCREMASYTLMSASDGVSMHTGDSGNQVWQATFSSSESIRGFAALFRQLYSNDEDGSYFVAQGIVSKAHRLHSDDSTDQREDILRPWRAAHGKLLQQRIEAIVGRMAANSYAKNESRAPVPFEDLRPTELISRYLYGDLIHWGDKRPQLEALRKDQVFADLDKLHFLEAMVGLAHFYLGFSIIAERALSLHTRS